MQNPNHLEQLLTNTYQCLKLDNNLSFSQFKQQAFDFFTPLSESCRGEWGEQTPWQTACLTAVLENYAKQHQGLSQLYELNRKSRIAIAKQLHHKPPDKALYQQSIQQNQSVLSGIKELLDSTPKQSPEYQELSNAYDKTQQQINIDQSSLNKPYDFCNRRDRRLVTNLSGPRYQDQIPGVLESLETYKNDYVRSNEKPYFSLSIDHHKLKETIGDQALILCHVRKQHIFDPQTQQYTNIVELIHLQPDLIASVEKVAQTEYKLLTLHHQHLNQDQIIYHIGSITRYLKAACPCDRGSSAIALMTEACLYLEMGLPLPKRTAINGMMHDIAGMVMPKKAFLNAYQQAIHCFPSSHVELAPPSTGAIIFKTLVSCTMLLKNNWLEAALTMGSLVFDCIHMKNNQPSNGPSLN